MGGERKTGKWTWPDGTILTLDCPAGHTTKTTQGDPNFGTIHCSDQDCEWGAVYDDPWIWVTEDESHADYGLIVQFEEVLSD